MDLCKDCKHYKMTLDGPYCLRSAGHPKPVSPIMAKDCFEERPIGELLELAVPMEKPGYVPRTKVCAKCGRETRTSAIAPKSVVDTIDVMIRHIWGWLKEN